MRASCGRKAWAVESPRSANCIRWATCFWHVANSAWVDPLSIGKSIALTPNAARSGRQAVEGSAFRKQGSSLPCAS